MPEPPEPTPITGGCLCGGVQVRGRPPARVGELLPLHALPAPQRHGRFGPGPDRAREPADRAGRGARSRVPAARRVGEALLLGVRLGALQPEPGRSGADDHPLRLVRLRSRHPAAGSLPRRDGRRLGAHPRRRPSPPRGRPHVRPVRAPPARAQTLRLERADRASSREEREHRVASAVAEERARIARELHDVIAHESERDRDPVGGRRGSARRMTTTLARAPLRDDPLVGGRGARRRCAGCSEYSATTAIRPSGRRRPGIARHPGARRAGLRRWESTTTLDRRRPAVAPPASVDLTAYRIVQEALTNVRKHAPGAPRHGWTGVARRRTRAGGRDDDDGAAVSARRRWARPRRHARARPACYGGTFDRRAGRRRRLPPCACVIPLREPA